MSKDREIDENSYKLKNYRSEFDSIVLNTEENLHILGPKKNKGFSAHGKGTYFSILDRWKSTCASRNPPSCPWPSGSMAKGQADRC